MMSGTSTRSLLKAGWVRILTAVCVVAIAAWCFVRIYYGDSQAPMDVIPNRWRVFLTIDGRDPAIKLEVTVNVLKTGPGRPAMVALFPTGTVFKNVKMNGELLDPVKQGDWHYAAISKSGRFVITADLEIKPDHDAGVTRISMRKPGFIQSILEVESAKAWDVSVSGVQGRIVGTLQHGTSGVLQVGQDDAFHVEWREPRPEVTRLGSPSVVPSVAWIIGERVLSANAVLNTDIVGGSREQMSLLLPKGASRVKVAGAAVRDFRLSDNRLTVFFHGQFAGNTLLNLSFDVPRQAGEVVACPSLEVEEGHVEAGGWIMVINDSPGLLLENRIAGVQETTDLDMPASVLGLAKGKPLYFYQSTARGAEPVFDVVDRTPFPIVDTIADRADIFTVIQPGGEEITRIHYTIRNNSRQFLRINLPAGAELFSAEVDNRACKVSEAGRTHLVPLVKSIQTVGGLVPFPVEIVYCRQGSPVKTASSRVVDLPELLDVPVAVVKAVLFSPETPAMKEYRSSLVRTGRWISSEDLDFGMGRRSDVISETWINRRLAREYYALGIASYQANNLEDADKFLTDAGRISNVDVLIQEQSKNLLGNIHAGRGDVNAGADRAERAKVLTIQQGLARHNEMLQGQQGQLIAAGLANLDSGNDELGAELLKQADEIGSQLANRSSSKSRQKAVRRDYGSRLSLVDEERKKNDELQTKFYSLQKKVKEIAVESGNKPQADAEGKALAQGMIAAASKRNMDVSQVQALDDYDAMNQPVNAVSADAKAWEIRSQLAANAAQPVPVTKQAGGASSLKDRNKALSDKVSVLEEALSWGKTGNVQAQVDQELLNRADSLIEQAEQKLAVISNALDSGDSVTMNDISAGRELTNLVSWLEVNRNTFGKLNDKLGNDFAMIEEQIKETNTELEKARQRRQAAQFVEVPLAGNGLDNRSGRQAFSRFLGDNYIPEEENGAQLYKMEDDKLHVWNRANMPENLNDIVRNFTDNGGRVVSVSGAKLVLLARNIPVVNDWFGSKTGAGHRYALLDEAQYRTIVQAAEFLRGQEDTGMADAGKKDVIVGTENGIAGQEFKLIRTEAGANTFSIDGSDISVPHNQYLAVENGNHVFVLKAGGVHDWQEEQGAASLPASSSSRLELPETGAPLFFEKTLLSAGESPDIEMVF